MTRSEARAAIAGRIFEGTVGADELDTLRRERVVIQSLLFEGRNRVRVWQPDGTCPAGFEPTAPTLEDAYLRLMRSDVVAEAPVAGGVR